MKAKFAVLANLALLTGLPLLTPHLVQSATTQDWPRFRGPQGNGIFSKLDLLPEGPKKLWQVKALPGKGSPVVVGGKVYLCGNAPGMALACLEADSGKNLWTTPLRNDGGNNTTPTVADGKVYLLGYRGQAFCLDAQTGTNLWAKDLRTRGDPEPSWGHAGAPLIWEDLVICNVGAGAAVKKQTGEVVWRHSGQGGYATPVLFTLKGKTGVAVFHGKALTARDPRSGEELWSIPWPTDRAVNACDPVFLGDKVLLSTTYGKGTALFDLAAAEPKQVWFEEKLGSAYCTGILWEGCVYGEAQRKPVCYDYETGRVRWQDKSRDGGFALLADGNLVYLTQKGRLLIAKASPEVLTPIVETQVLEGTTWGPPAISGGKLYVRSESGELACWQIAQSISK